MKKRRLRLLLIVGPLVLFCLVEGLLASFFAQHPRGFSPDQFQAREGLLYLNPSVRGAHLSRDFHVSVEANEHGYRAGTWSPLDGEALPTLWVFGDSFAFGWGVEGHQTFAHQLQSHFKVLNFAMPDEHWGHYLKRLRDAEQAYEHPDVILVTTYDNDFSDSSGIAAQPSLSRNSTSTSLRSRLLRLHTARLAVRLAEQLSLADLLADLFGSDDLTNRVYAEHLSIHQSEYYDSPRWAASVKPIEEFLETAQALGAEVLVVRITPAYANGLTWQARALQAADLPETLDTSRLNEELDALCRNRGAQFHPFVPESDEQTRQWYFKHDMHLTAEGHRALADFLGKILQTAKG